MENVWMFRSFLHYEFLSKVSNLFYKTFHFRVFYLEDNLKEGNLKLKQINVIKICGPWLRSKAYQLE